MKYYGAPYFTIIKNAGIRDSFNKSSDALYGYKFRLFSFVTAGYIFNKQLSFVDSWISNLIHNSIISSLLMISWSTFIDIFIYVLPLITVCMIISKKEGGKHFALRLKL